MLYTTYQIGDVCNSHQIFYQRKMYLKLKLFMDITRRNS